MTEVERYNYQKRNGDIDDPVGRMFKAGASILARSLVSTLNSELDRYIVAMV